MAGTAPRQTLFRSAAVVSAAVAASRASGLVREMIMARLFGAGQAYDAFLLGFRIPNLTRDLFAEGALSSAFVPVFSEYLSARGRREAAHLANLVATSLVLVVGALCLVGMLFSPSYVSVLAPGFADSPAKFDLSVRLTRIMFPFLITVALAAQAMGILNASHRFGVPALASACFNVASVGFGLAFGYLAAPRLGISLIEAMAYGVVFGGCIQLLWQAPSLLRAGFAPRPAFDWSDPGLRYVLRLMGPAVLGSAAVQINVMVNTNFASEIRDAAGHPLDGPVSWLGYAFRFMQLPLGLFGVAIASAALPSISRSAAAERLDEFRDTLAHALGMVFLLTIPSSVGLAVLGESMIGTIYQAGRFTAYDSRQTALALAGYAFGLAGYAATKILAPAFYALGDACTPMLVSLGSIAVNLAAAVALVKVGGLGHAGLALSTSLVALTGSAALFAVLRRRVGGLHGRKLLGTASRVAIASAAMGAACLTSSRAIHAWAGAGRLGHAVDAAVSIPLGVAVFAVLAYTLGVRELREAWPRAHVLHFRKEECSRN